MKLAYRGIDSDGKTVSDVIEAPTIAGAVESLRQEGLFVTDISESTGRKRLADAPASKGVKEEGRL